MQHSTIFLQDTPCGTPPIISLNPCLAANGQKATAIYLEKQGYSPPLERIYFLTIDEMVHLMQRVRKGRIRLHEALKRAAAADADPNARKFMLSMHLDEWTDSQGLFSPLADSFVPVIDGLTEILKAGEST